MILSQPALRKAVALGEIVFEPALEEDQWGEASIDIRLGFSFTKLKNIPGLKVSVARGLAGIGNAGFWQTKNLNAADIHGKRECFDLDPGEFILAMTHEIITVPNTLIALVEGRSTYARMGLSMHQTAPWIQPGWHGPIVLEIMNNGPLTIELTPLVDRPCQLTFFQLSDALSADLTYGSRPTDAYQGQRHPLKHDKKSDN